MGARVIRVPGASPIYLVQVRREALSAELLATAFMLINRAETHYAKHTLKDVSLFVPDAAPPPLLRAQDRERFERIVAQLRTVPKGGVVEVGPGG